MTAPANTHAPAGVSVSANPLVAPLFQRIQVRGLALANRVVMAPMTREFSPDGVPGDDVVAYYRRRAEAETGLIITEGVGIDHPAALGEAGLGEADIPHLYGDQALAGWGRVVDAVHAAGGKIIPQLWHQGVMREQGTGPHPEAPSVRPSGLKLMPSSVKLLRGPLSGEICVSAAGSGHRCSQCPSRRISLSSGPKPRGKSPSLVQSR